MNQITADALLSGNRRILAKAITLVESKKDEHRQAAQTLLEAVIPHSGKSIRIGITGIPGVGKSTFIEAFGQHLVALDKKVAVLAVDPSSPIAGGSILGDKTRMEHLSRLENAFIRPSPSEGSLGGVAHKTRETMILCEAAGYDVILVETVGVGQSEYEVASMVDFFLVLMLPNAGDELQGIKKGILELSDALVINKSDGESINLAQQTQRHYQNAFHLLKPSSFWSPRVLKCSALKNEGINEVWSMVEHYKLEAINNHYFEEKRARQNAQWMKKLMLELLELRMKQNPEINRRVEEYTLRVTEGSMTPYLAAKTIIDLL